MTELVSNLMVTEVKFVAADDTMDSVQKYFGKHRLKVAPVVDKNAKVFGLINFFHILHQYSLGKNMKTIQAWEVCTHDFIQVRPTTPLREVINLMLEGGTHTVVVTEDGFIRGMLSASDVFRKLSITKRFEN